jgi:hypothetical protein
MKQQITADDRLIESEMQRLSLLALRQGVNAANSEVVSRLIAYMRWLDDVNGTRDSYTLFQGIADQLIE